MSNKKENGKVKSINGYPLFHDVEDKELQIRNRAIVLVNIIQDNSFKGTGKVNQTGLTYAYRYQDQVDEEDRPELSRLVKEELIARGLL